MAWKAGTMKYATSKLAQLPPGMILSSVLNGRQIRRETVFLDGSAFHRYTLDPGLRTEYVTFYSTDEEKLRTGILKRIERTVLG
jgi:hypothetical protein